MDKSLEEKLITCLDALERGESVNAILARYPESAAQLRPMLETVQLLEQRSFFPSNATHQQAKQTFLGKAAEIRRTATPRRSWWGWLFRPALSLGGGLALVVAMVVWGAQSAVPGDALYGAKQAREQVQLLWAGGGTEGLSVQQQLNQERLREVATLLAERRTAEVSFDGVVEQAVGDVWQIEGLPMTIQATTDFTGFVGEGQLVHVRALTLDGQLLAIAITPLTVPEVVQTPLPATIPALEPTPTITATEIVDPVVTTATEIVTPVATTATEIVTPVATTAVPTPIVSPSATPSSTPTPLVTPAPQPSPDPEPEETDEPDETKEPDDDYDDDDHQPDDNDDG